SFSDVTGVEVTIIQVPDCVTMIIHSRILFVTDYFSERCNFNDISEHSLEGGSGNGVGGVGIIRDKTKKTLVVWIFQFFIMICGMRPAVADIDWCFGRDFDCQRAADSVGKRFVDGGGDFRGVFGEEDSGGEWD